LLAQGLRHRPIASQICQPVAANIRRQIFWRRLMVRPTLAGAVRVERAESTWLASSR